MANLWFLEDKMVNLGLIYFQKDGQNKFEVHISKNIAKIANFQPKIGQDANFAPTLNGHNSVKLHFIPSSFCTHGPKTSLKLWVHVKAITPNP